MKCKNGNSEREYQDRLEILRKNAFNTQLQPLRSLETATKKRRALKKKAADNSGFTKSTSTTSGLILRPAARDNIAPPSDDPKASTVRCVGRPRHERE
jgi:hypothetical protein